MMPGLMVLTRAQRLPHRTASAITLSEFPRFGDLVSMERIRHLVWLEHWKSEQLVGWRGRKRLVLLRSERWETVPRLRGDYDACSAVGNDVSELLKYECGTI